MREGDFDTGVVKMDLHKPAVGMTDRELVARRSLDADTDVHRAVGQGGYARDFNGFKQFRLDLFIGGQLFKGVLQMNNGFINTLAVGDAIDTNVVAKITHVVGYGINA